MPEDVPQSECPFDLERLRQLIELMEQYNLTEIRLERGDEKWKLNRGSQQEFVQIPAPVPAAAVSTPAAQPRPEPQPQEVADNALSIKSPTVGTFYAAPSPDDPPFVAVGAKVQPDTIVCIVEAMKVFNQIPAEVSGIIDEVLVNNGDPVEFGQPLFRVRPG